MVNLVLKKGTVQSDRTSSRAQSGMKSRYVLPFDEMRGYEGKMNTKNENEATKNCKRQKDF